MEFFLLKSFVMALSALALAVLGASAASASEWGEGRRAVLVVSFGTFAPEAERAVCNLADAVRRAFPDVELRLAYTSNVIRRRLAKERNVDIPTPASALARMNDEGFTHVYVMPTHIVHGEEYEDIKCLVEAFASVKGKYGFKELKLGAPCLSSAADCGALAGVLARRFAKELERGDTAVVLMGHGTPRRGSNAMYALLQLALDREAPGRFFIGTLKAAPLLDDLLPRLAAEGWIRRLVLSPLMIVAGSHASRELADSERAESWYCRLRAAGYGDISLFLSGLGEDAGMAALYVSRIRDMMRQGGQ
ncbi:MAG: sirohydrochlorin cobaltochelatase [Synergistaceae bacterium]|nr:sirohydrochlorin cobaltochelatase [Synergistaceae bacterium]